MGKHSYFLFFYFNKSQIFTDKKLIHWDEYEYSTKNNRNQRILKNLHYRENIRNRRVQHNRIIELD